MQCYTEMYSDICIIFIYVYAQSRTDRNSKNKLNYVRKRSKKKPVVLLSNIWQALESESKAAGWHQVNDQWRRHFYPSLFAQSPGRDWLCPFFEVGLVLRLLPKRHTSPRVKPSSLGLKNADSSYFLLPGPNSPSLRSQREWEHTSWQRLRSQARPNSICLPWS